MADRPNILLIMADELRADALGCYGNRVCRTPNLDALAASGVRFANAFTPNPICVPARATITTGNYSHVATGTKNNTGLIHDNQPKIAEHFGAQGYRTYACGKLHYVPYSSPDQPRLVHGFDVWDSTESGRVHAQYDPRGEKHGLEDYIDYLAEVGWAGYSRAHGIGNNDVRPCPSPLPEEHHVDHWVADRSIARLQQHMAETPDDPFLLWCSFPKPHEPLDPPWDYANLYDPREVEPPVGDASMLDDRNPVIQSVRHSHAIVSLSPEAMRVIKAYYYGLITFQDAQVGRVMRALEESGAAENTIVFYMADHGDLMGDFGGYFKSCFQRGSVSVPFFVSGPGIPQGEVRQQLAGLQDILPTLAARTGCPLEHDVHGLDLSEALADTDAPLRDVYYGQCLDAPRQSAMVTDGQWKYIYNQWGGIEELYHLQEDPDELRNLATDNPDAPECRQWRERLMDEARRLGDDALLDGDALPTSPLDRDELVRQPVGGMGWRWY